MISQIFVSVIFSLFLGSSALEIVADSDLTYKTIGIQCINKTSFTLYLTVLKNVMLMCPDGYICDSSTEYPCTANTTTTTESTTPTTKTSTSTTEKVYVARPTGFPICTSPGWFPAPYCSQVVECVERTFLFWKYYTSVLITCSQGQHYDTGLKHCIRPELSDCLE